MLRCLVPHAFIKVGNEGRRTSFAHLLALGHGTSRRGPRSHLFTLSLTPASQGHTNNRGKGEAQKILQKYSTPTYQHRLKGACLSESVQAHVLPE